VLADEGDDVKPPGSCVIAIDFGTSRSAFAYGFVGGNGSVTVGVPANSVISESLQVKAETTLVLDKNLKAVAFGLKGRKTVYSRSAADMYLFQWFKMHLKSISNDADETINAYDHKGRPGPLMTVISEALSFISKSAIEEVRKATNTNIQPMDVYWAITVPAIWSAGASGFMRRAALKAGMTHFQLSQMLTLVREPEAACVDLLDDIDKKNTPVKLENGAELLVLDCGGGTNDMTFVKIKCKEPLVCQELKPAAGGTAGAASIDRHLRQLLEDLFGQSRYSALKSLPSMIDLMDEWEQFKVSFEGEGSFTCDLNGIIDDHYEQDSSDAITEETISALVTAYNHAHPAETVTNRRLRIVVPEPVLVKWFDSVVDVVISDLKEQLAHPACKTISIVYLVGGFCANKYLIEKVTKYIKDNHSKIDIVAAKHSDVAIVRGAAIAALRSNKPLIHDHVMDVAYGVGCTMVYNAAKHDLWQAYTGSDGKQRVNIFDMYVQRGEHVAMNFVTPEECYNPLTPGQSNLTIPLYTSSHPTATRSTVLYQDDTSVKRVASVTVPLDKSVPFDDRKVYVSIKFGMEIQVLVRDHNRKPYKDASCVFYS
jgi:molecular chaperone DnaK (HSP70)